MLWGPLAAAIITVMLFRAIDARLKTSEVIGFAPLDAQWIAVTEDFGAFWSGVEQSDVMETLLADGRHPLTRVLFHVRRVTGIRPTPSRWNLWLGPTLTTWQRDGSMGFSARPGLLMRVAHLLRPSGRTFEQGVPIYRYNMLYYTWHDGHIVAASTPRDVLDAVELAPAHVGRAEQEREVRVTARIPEEVQLRVIGADGLPVSGWIRLPMTGGNGVPAPETLPDPPVAFLAAADGRDLAGLLRLAGRKIAEVEHAQPVAAFTGELARQWDLPSLESLAAQAPGEHALALADIDESLFPPLPVLSWIVRPAQPPRGLHPWADFLPPGHALAFEWNNRPGLLAPWLSEKLTLCLGQTDTLWIAATRETLMADIVLAAHDAARVEADVLLHLDWDKTGRALAILLRQLVQLDLIRDDGVYPFSEGRAGHAERIRRLGILELRGKAHDDGLHITGHLARLEGPI